MNLKILSFVFLLAGVITSPAETLAYWRFEKSFDSGSVFHDESANALHLATPKSAQRPELSDSVPSATPPIADNNHSLAFIASQRQYLTSNAATPLNFATGQAFTIEGFLYLNSYSKTPQTQRQVLFKRGDLKQEHGHGWGVNVLAEEEGGNLAFVQSFDGKVLVIKSGKEVPLNKWVHFAIVREADGMCRIYLDGELQQQRKFPAAALTNSAPLVIGSSAFTSNPNFFWDGSLDEIRISSEALKPEQFLSH